MSNETFPASEQPEEGWEQFSETHPPVGNSAENFAACDSPFYAFSKLEASPLPEYEDPEVFIAEGRLEADAHNKAKNVIQRGPRQFVYGVVAELKTWDEEARADHEPVAHTRQLLGYLQVQPADRNVLLAHRARRLAYRHARADFESREPGISKEFCQSLPIDPEEQDWQGLIEGTRRNAYGDALAKQILDLCLPLMVNNGEEFKLAQTVACLTLYQISMSKKRALARMHLIAEEADQTEQAHTEAAFQELKNREDLDDAA